MVSSRSLYRLEAILLQQAKKQSEHKTQQQHPLGHNVYVSLTLCVEQRCKIQMHCECV